MTVRTLYLDLPSPVDLRTVSRICVTLFNISWNASNRITCGDVSYEVFGSQPQIEGRMENITRVGDTFYFSVTGLNNSDPDNVTITVTASNRAGQGNMSISVRLPESLGKCCVYTYICNVTIYYTNSHYVYIYTVYRKLGYF